VIWIDAVVRIAAGCAALAAFYVAWFVYEDEERKLQNKIETWWLELDDIRNSMVSRQAAFVVVIAQKANAILDRMFGPRLLAKDSIAAAASLTIAGYYFSVALLVAIAGVRGPPSWVAGAVAVTILACAGAPLASPRLRLFPRLVMWAFIASVVLVVLTTALFLGASLIDEEPPEHFSSMAEMGPQNVFIMVAVSAAIALTLFQVAVARRAMRSTIVAKSEWPVLLGMIFVAAPVGIMLTLMMATERTGSDAITLSNVATFMGFATGMACIISMALWSLLAVIATLMLLHRLVWPLASRLLYSLARYRIVQNKKVLNAAGTMLLGIAITGAYGWRLILKHFGLT
jgi:hypothetical protein